MKAGADDLDRCTTRTRAAMLSFGVLAIAVGMGCSRHRVDTGASAPVVARRPQASSAPPAQALPPPSGVSPSWPTGSIPTAAAPKGSTQEEEEAEEEAVAEKPRDFSTELRRMLGDLGSCVQARAPEKAGAINISVTAHVMPSGAAPYSEVDASQLEAEELKCVKARVEGVHFAPPIKDAPFTVQASVQVTPKIRAVEKQEGARADSMGMIVTQEPSGEGVSPGIVPPSDPGVVPPPDPGVIPTPVPPAYAIPELPVPVQQ
jgi:hypothetical protein